MPAAREVSAEGGTEKSSDPTRSDGALLAAVAGGDLRALGQLCDRHARAAWDALRGEHPAEEADEALRIAFVDLAESAKSVPAEEIGAWVLERARASIRKKERGKMLAKLGAFAEPILGGVRVELDSAPDDKTPAPTTLDDLRLRRLRRRVLRDAALAAPAPSQVRRLLLAGATIGVILGMGAILFALTSSSPKLPLSTRLEEPVPRPSASAVRDAGPDAR